MEHNHLRRIIGTFADGFYCKPGLLLYKEFLARFPLGRSVLQVSYCSTAQAFQCGISGILGGLGFLT